MNFKNNATYRFICRADKNRSLNVYGDSGSVPNSQTNVCLYTSGANDTCQQWIYKESGGNKYFVCKKNPNLALDMYTGSTSGQTNVNAHVYAPSNTSYLAFEDTDSGYIKIRLSKYSNKYLTANQGDNGTNTGRTTHDKGNVYWYAGGLTDHSQEWKPVLVDGGSTPDPDPGKGQKLIYPFKTQYYTVGYKGDAPAYVSLGYSTHYANDFYGVDSTVCASGEGRIVDTNRFQYLGRTMAVQYDNVLNHNGKNIGSIIIRYSHLKEYLKTSGKVQKGEPIAIQGADGGGAKGIHVHMEVDTDINYPMATPSENGGVDTTLDPLSILYRTSSQTVAPDSDVGESSTDSAGRPWYNISKIRAVPIA